MANASITACNPTLLRAISQYSRTQLCTLHKFTQESGLPENVARFLYNLNTSVLDDVTGQPNMTRLARPTQISDQNFTVNIYINVTVSVFIEK